MTRQWIRDCRLTVGTSSGDVLDLSNLRIRFHVTQASIQVPNAADVVVYNLADATAQKFRKENLPLNLEAGYQEGSGIIFKGETIQTRTGRENPVDTYVGFVAKTADKAYNYAVVNKALAAGHTMRDQVDVAIEAMKPFGVTVGFIADLGSRKLPSGRSLFGMARDLLRDVATATGTTWSIQNNVLQMVKNDAAAPGDTIVLNSNTGMIGRPVQTIDGIIVRCLLNPRIKPDCKLQIDQKSINQAAFNPAYGAEVNNALLAKIADDGIYKALVVDHHGDTRGGPWYTDTTCIRFGDAIPISLAARGIPYGPA